MTTILHGIQEISNTTILLMTHSTMTILTTKGIKMTVTVSPFTVLTVLIKKRQNHNLTTEMLLC